MMTACAVAMMAATLAAGPAFAQTPAMWQEDAARRLALAQASEGAVDRTREVDRRRQVDQTREEVRARDAAQDRRDRDSERGDRENALFEQASSLMDAGRWERAVDVFSRVAELRGARADGALYWKAYAQDRVGQRSEALTTIAELSKAYPQSRYVRQAQALDMEVRRRVGQPVSPEAQADEDLKLMAVNGLLNSDPEKAIPILQQLLNTPASPRVADRAVFVLAQSSSPRAKQVLKDLARGSATPELQSKAIQYLGVMGGADSRATLADVYGATTDVDVKRRILRAFMAAGEKQRLLTAAQTEQHADLRGEAVRQLGVMGAGDELWQMYQKETAAAVKKQIIQAMFVGGHASRMSELARGEKDPDLRAAAVRNLGLMGGATTGDTLVDIYGTEHDPAVRRSVVNALFLQGNAVRLVALARKETDVQLKKAIVEKLSLMNDKAATDYMLELLTK